MAGNLSPAKILLGHGLCGELFIPCLRNCKLQCGTWTHCAPLLAPGQINRTLQFLQGLHWWLPSLIMWLSVVGYSVLPTVNMGYRWYIWNSPVEHGWNVERCHLEVTSVSSPARLTTLTGGRNTSIFERRWFGWWRIYVSFPERILMDQGTQIWGMLTKMMACQVDEVVTSDPCICGTFWRYRLLPVH